MAAIAIAVALLSPARNLMADEINVFGQETGSDGAMMGILYDLKQTQDHKLTWVNPVSYYLVVDEFLSKKWDESVLNRYYRVSRPLYTTQIFIPTMAADAAPKAFNAENKVKPSLWIVHYKAQVSPPEDGTYRFVGSADDMLAVAINGKTVLSAPLFDPQGAHLPLTKWITPEPGGILGLDFGNLVNGDWIQLKKDDAVDLDVIIGECPGGLFSAFLLIEKQGGHYQQDASHHAILPIFQVAPYDTPPPASPRWAPPFAKGYPPWRSYQ